MDVFNDNDFWRILKLKVDWFTIERLFLSVVHTLTIDEYDEI